MGFVKNIVQKNKWLFWLSVFIEVVIIALPQWLDSVWDLAEKTQGRPLTMHHLPFWAFAITVPVGLIMFGVTICAVRSKKTEIVVSLTDTLTKMHRRLVEIQKKKAKDTRIGFSRLNEVLPTLADKLDIVKLRDWSEFEESLKGRLQAAMPKPHAPLSFVKRKEREQRAVLWVTSEVKKELFESRQWTFEDGMKISEWLNGFHWGVKEERDKDIQWSTLFESLSPYLTDAKLRELINKHIDFSRLYNDVCLIHCYSERFPKTAFFPILYAALVGSSISPEKAEIALGEVLSDIEKRLVELGGSSHLGVEVAKDIVKPTNGG